MTDREFRRIIRSSFQEIMTKKIYETIFVQEDQFILMSFCNLSDVNRQEVIKFIDNLVAKNGGNSKQIIELDKIKMMKNFELKYPKIYELVTINAKKETFEKFKRIVGD
ncbi:hypothetical protein UT300003_32400 [Clostridium sardiniense]